MLSAITKRELKELLEKWDFKDAQIEEDVGIVRIVTDRHVPRHWQEVVQSILPAGVMATFSFNSAKKEPVPISLMKWWKDTERYLKK